jgi:thiol-disulfide isomerase/thioredoxin
MSSVLGTVLSACAGQPSARAPVPGGPIAPEVMSDTWLNTDPLPWDALRGQVVMVEFWTYGCYNCRNVLPELKSMYADYRDRGFTLLGVHAPEFDHERDPANVRKAVQTHGIVYPVVIDNDFANWKRYRNRYWPAWYLVDKRGALRWQHIGEGAYDETRMWIETLLKEA